MGIKSKSLTGVIIANILWGLSYVISGELLMSMNAISIIAIRSIIATIVLSGYMIISQKSMRIKHRKDIPKFILLSLFQPVIYFLFELYAIKHTSPTFVSLLMCSVPILIPIEIYLTEKIKPNPRLKYGILISVVGVIGVIMGGGVASQLIQSGWGILATIGAVLCATGYNLVLRRLTGNYSPVMITTYQNIIGSILFMPIFFAFDFHNLMNTVITHEMIRSLIILGVLCSSVAYLLYVNSVKHLGASATSMINNVSPIATAVGAYFIFSERLTIIQIIGIIITIYGLIYGTSSLKAKK